MDRRILRIPLLLLPALSCAEAQNEPNTPAYLPDPPWLVLRVETVQVSPFRPGTTDPWDTMEPQPTDGTACGLVGKTIATTEPITGAGAEFLCSFDQRPSPEGADPRFPDLMLLLGIGSGALYQSPTAPNTAEFRSNAEFIVPTNTIPTDGISLVVVDRDGPNSEIIGAFKLTRQDLIARAANQPIFTLNSGAIMRMDLVVTPYSARIESTEFTINANTGGSIAPIRPIRAGETVEISAKGHYRIGTGRGAWIDPKGYFEQEPHDPNFANAPFSTSPHGAAIATIGGGDARNPSFLTPCTRTVARTPGLLWVGINDAIPTNNDGSITYEVKIYGPTPSEWTDGKTTVPCGTF